MNDASASTPRTPAAARTVPRSRPYLRLLWMIPGLAMLAVGLYRYTNVEEGGEVTTIKLTTKSGFVGQAAEAVANIQSNPDLYLKVTTASGEIDLPVQKDTPVGNGLEWKLPKTIPLHHLQRIDVFDHRWIRSDPHLDHITLSGWGAEGQRFRVDLLGQRSEPPKWALPVAAVGGAITLLVLLRFVWDQVI